MLYSKHSPSFSFKGIQLAQPVEKDKYNNNKRVH